MIILSYYCNMKIKELVISIFILATISANGQGVSVSFGSDGIQFPDTLSLGDTVYYSCWVVNTGDDVLAENILLNAAGYNQAQGLINTRTIGGQGPNFIFPGDSIQFSPNFLYEIVTPQNYQIGDNIVVIWPKVTTPVNQSTQYEYKNVYVNGQSIISSTFEVKDKISFYPQPANEMVALATNKNLKSIQFYDLLGRELLFNETLNQNQINVSSISSGMYVATLIFEDGTSVQERLQIQH